MRRSACLCFTGLAMVLVIGCGGEGQKKGAPKVKVSGTVQLDGKPMPKGEIRFRVSGEIESALEITNGTYSGDVCEGKNRVEIYLFVEDKSMSPPSLKNLLPSMWNSDSKLSAEVTSSTKDIPVFKITSK